MSDVVEVPASPRRTTDSSAAGARAPILRARGLIIGYRPRSPVLEPLSLDVGPGELLGVVGPNGVGKTCLLLTLAGALPPLGGERHVAPGHRIALVPQIAGAYEMLSVRQNIAFFARLAGRPAGLKVVRQIMDEAGLDVPPGQQVRFLSGGYHRRVSIACGFAVGASLLLMDEPTANLDSGARRSLIKTLRRYVDESDRALLISSHDIREIEELCDDVIVLFERRKIAQGPPRTLAAQMRAEVLEVRLGDEAAVADAIAYLQPLASRVRHDGTTVVAEFAERALSLRAFARLPERLVHEVESIELRVVTLEDALLELFRPGQP